MLEPAAASSVLGSCASESTDEFRRLPKGKREDLGITGRVGASVVAFAGGSSSVTVTAGLAYSSDTLHGAV
jgi:hypothetical protein